MNKDELLMINELVKLFNYIGEAGINGLHEIGGNIEIGSGNTYYLDMTTKRGEGYAYHFYDYTFDIKTYDDRSITFKTEALEYPCGNDYNHDTKLSIIFHLPDDKDYTAVSYIRGWGYGNILNLKSEYFINNSKIEVDEGIKETGIIPRYYRSSLIGIDELELILEFLDKEIESEISTRAENQEKIDGLLNSLSKDEIKLLKKTLKEYK